MVSRWVVLVSFHADAERDAVDRWIHAAAKLTERDKRVVFSDAGRHVSRQVGPGDGFWDITTEGDLDEIEEFTTLLASAVVGAKDQVALHVIDGRIDAIEGARFKRILLLRVRSGVGAADTEAFERALAAMPARISSIRSWALSRTKGSTGVSEWTHVFEQEFTDLNGLIVEYKRHPYHWTAIGRWIDPEIPGSIVDEFADYVREAGGAVLIDQQSSVIGH